MPHPLGVRRAAWIRDTTLDEHLVELQALHRGVAADHPLLHVEAFALVGLGDGVDAGIAVDVAGGGRGGGRRCSLAWSDGRCWPGTWWS